MSPVGLRDRAAPLRLGLISDTHGLLRPEAVQALSGAVELLHAGDVGKPAVLAGLERLAPVHAVRGNVDRWPGADGLPTRLDLTRAGVRIRIVHDRAEVGDDRDLDVVVYGHSHRPRVETVGDVLYVNPGSAGPRRFSLPVSVATLVLGDGPPRAELVELVVAPARRRVKKTGAQPPARPRPSG